MSDLKPLLPDIEKVLEFNAQLIRRSTDARAVMILIVHEDMTTQSTAAVSPETVARAVFALRALADKIEKNEGVRLEMRKDLKN